MVRERDLFFAIVLSGMALTGCGEGADERDAGALADAAEDGVDAGEPLDAGAAADASLEDAGEDAMVLIL
jgi:hypothetical protein